LLFLEERNAFFFFFIVVVVALHNRFLDEKEDRTVLFRTAIVFSTL
jgi:hypothetical protein